MDSFHDVRFPARIAFGATGGPVRRNEIVQLTSGVEKRNARTAHSRRRYDAGTGLRSVEDLYLVMEFFEARRGSLHAFRFRDPFDMKSCAPNETVSALDQTLGIGDGETKRFQIVKIYGSGPDAYSRIIRYPVAETVRVAVNRVEKIREEDFSVGPGGEVVFEEPPPAGSVITAGFEFDVPVRFDTEQISAGITSFQAGHIPSIPLIEVLS